MRLIQKLKQLEKQLVYLRWGSESEYGKINYVGYDFLEFNILDAESMEYTETVMINHQMLLEIVIGGSDINRILAEYSSRLPSAKSE